MEPKKITENRFWDFYKNFRQEGGNCACIGTNFREIDENGILAFNEWKLIPDSALSEVIYYPETEHFKITPKGECPHVVTFFKRASMN